MTRASLVFLLAGSFSVFAAACSKQPELQSEEKKPAAVAASSPAPSASPAAAPPASASSAAAWANGPTELAYDAPKAWESVPNTNQMRKATFKVPRQGGDTEDAELTVSAAAGSREANLSRWYNQFGQVEPSKKEERTINGLPVTIVEVKGPYGGMGGGPKKEGYMLLGAIVPGPAPQQHFFKLTGPEKTVTAARKDFDAFVSSLRAK